MLLVLFVCFGNSFESVVVVELVDCFVDGCCYFVFMCVVDGMLNCCFGMYLCVYVVLLFEVMYD